MYFAASEIQRVPSQFSQKYKFGNEKFPCIGNIHIRIPVASDFYINVTPEIVDANIPFLLRSEALTHLEALLGFKKIGLLHATVTNRDVSSPKAGTSIYQLAYKCVLYEAGAPRDTLEISSSGNGKVGFYHQTCCTGGLLTKHLRRFGKHLRSVRSVLARSK